MLEWLTENALAVQALSAAGALVVTVVLVVVTAKYGKWTKDMAKATSVMAATQVQNLNYLERQVHAH